MKQMGARNAGNPHVACDVEGAGDVERSGHLGRPARQSSTLLMSGDGRRGDAERPSYRARICSTRLNDRFALQDSANRLIRIESASCCGANDRSNGSEKIGAPV